MKIIKLSLKINEKYISVCVCFAAGTRHLGSSKLSLRAMKCPTNNSVWALENHFSAITEVSALCISKCEMVTSACSVIIDTSPRAKLITSSNQKIDLAAHNCNLSSMLPCSTLICGSSQMTRAALWKWVKRKKIVKIQTRSPFDSPWCMSNASLTFLCFNDWAINHTKLKTGLKMHRTRWGRMRSTTH